MATQTDVETSATTGTGLAAEREPELAQIVSSLVEVTARLEMRGMELMAFEPKVRLNGAQPSSSDKTGHEPPSVDSYAESLRAILGRLMAVDEERFAPAVAMFRAFL